MRNALLFIGMAWGCLVVTLGATHLIMRGELPNPMVTLFWLAVAVYCFDARNKGR